MALLFLIFASLPVFAADNASHCQWALEDLDDFKVRNVIARVELTFDRVERLYGNLARSFRGMPLLARFEPPERATIVEKHLPRFWEIAIQTTLGNDAIARLAAAGTAAEMEFLVDPEALFAQVGQVAKHFEADLTMVHFASDGAPSVEHLSYHLAREHVDHGAPRADVGPYEIEVIKTALQYGSTRGPVRMLALANLSPAIPIALHYFTSKPITLLQPNAAPAAVTDWLDSNSVEVASSLAEETARGPFQLVVAHNPVAFDAATAPESASDALRTLGDRMNHGATFVIAFDGNASVNLTPERAQAAGFEVVRWADERVLPSHWIRLRPAHIAEENALRQTIFVLRKGALDQERAHGDSREAELAPPGPTTVH